MLRHQLRPPEDRRIRRLDLLGPCWAPRGPRPDLSPSGCGPRPFAQLLFPKRLEGKNITNNPRKINQRAYKNQSNPSKINLGGLLGASWGFLGASWRRLGGALALLGGLLVSWSRPGRVLGASWWATWLQLGSQNGAYIHKNSKPKSINF